MLLHAHHVLHAHQDEPTLRSFRAYNWQQDSAAHALEALQQLAAAQKSIKKWNMQVAAARSSGASSQGPLFTQRLNHFAHLSQQQFEQLLLPNKHRQPVERTAVSQPRQCCRLQCCDAAVQWQLGWHDGDSLARPISVVLRASPVVL